MELKVIRQQLSPRSTIGELYVDGEFECYTLEDCVRPVKIKGVTAIPAGIYEVVINWSARFKKPLPLLLNVPNFDGVRIHPGNTDADTEGCLLVGKTKAKDFIGNSRAAFTALFAKLQAAAEREKVFIEIAQEAAAPRGALAPGGRSVRRRVAAPAAKSRRKRAAIVGKGTRRRQESRKTSRRAATGSRKKKW